ncbi:MAG TPA: DNA-directed RNA polymerase subunit alpha [Candidatus Babeliales bacterium]|jgi:DNA-directed RNA polymerase subunit alpha|nr:DNA-directed RNA polymerase subunit alpha [Candidatus Babeliales bacterium]
MEKHKYKPLIIPRVEWDTKTLSKTFGEVTAQPLEPGLGTTFGSAIRRVLLGAIEGAAVTSVRITGVNNEFSVIPGVLEDTMQLILNIKQIVVRNKTGMSGTMKLRFAGEGIVRVSHIEAESHLELINPEHILARVASDGILEIEFFVDMGRSYQPAQWPTDKSYLEDGRIYLDAMFSPVTNVIFDVQKTRVGKDIDYDKLILQITTNGSELPTDVYNYAVSVLRTQLEHFLVSTEIPFNLISVNNKEEEAPAENVGNNMGLSPAALKLLLKPIEELELSARAYNCLIQEGIKRVIDLVKKPEEEALKIKNFGRKSLNEVAETLNSFGLSFGMRLNEEDIVRRVAELEEE